MLYDDTEAGLRLEVEGHAHFFAGADRRPRARAGTPAMVVAIHVRPGERVEVGQALGVLEAMKMEIASPRRSPASWRRCARSADSRWPPATCCW